MVGLPFSGRFRVFAGYLGGRFVPFVLGCHLGLVAVLIGSVVAWLGIGLVALCCLGGLRLVVLAVFGRSLLIALGGRLLRSRLFRDFLRGQTFAGCVDRSGRPGRKYLVVDSPAPFGNPGRLAGTTPQVVELLPPDPTARGDLESLDLRR